jgi:methyltransferase-like protein
MALNQILYDELPYTCHPMPYAHPERLATVATFFGMTPPAVEGCRVLELGCCDASHLIPIAYALPNAECWGVDSSAAKIESGQALVDALGLKNVKLRHLDILEVDERFGQFDYIIAHGIYSWVSQAVQDKILSICKHHLVPNGVAYVSYDTKPGWNMRETFRDMMRYHTVSITDKDTRTEQLKALTKFMVNTTAQSQDTYNRFVNEEIREFVQLPSAFVSQTFLDEENKPLYFYEFIETAQGKGLGYLGDAFPHTMFINNFPKPVTKALQMFKNDLIRLEQIMDFLRNRAFRHTLLCHEGTQLNRTLPSDLMQRFYITSSLQPVIESANEPTQKFENARGTVSSDKPMIQAALRYLSQQWPHAVAFSEVIQQAQQETGNVSDTKEETAVSDTLLKCYSMGLLELHSHSPQFVTTISQYPKAYPLAQWQAQRGTKITNCRCQWFNIDNVLFLQLLPHLDGTHDRTALVNLIDGWLKEGKMTINLKNQQTGEPLTLNDENRHEILGGVLDNTLQKIAQSALLIG